MADKSKIAWCDATINPCYGCSPVSPACDNCYAARLADRMAHNVAVCQYYEGLTDRDGRWTGRVNLFPRQMEQAFRWRRPRRIFLGSMTDLFHENVPDEFLDQLFACVALAPRHTFLVLTKRPERMRAYFTRFSRRHHTQVLERAAMAMFGEDAANAVGNALDGVLAEGHNVGWPMRHVILMATVEDQPRADERMPHMIELAGMGWRTGVSIEPMLGPVDLRSVTVSDHGGIRKTWDVLGGTSSTHHPVFGGGGVAPGRLSWVICGGESGPHARPMHPDWVRSLRDQCAAVGVPFLFKQWGEWAPTREDPYGKAEPRRIGEHGRNTANLDNCTPDMGNEVYVYRVGKYRAGRLLDGVEHNASPESRP